MSASTRPRSSSNAPDPSHYTRSVALHPIRRATPDQKGCNAYGSGAPPPTTSIIADTPSPQTPTVHLGRSHTASTCSPRLRTRGATPVTSRNTRYVALHPIRRGVIPTDRVHHLPRQAQLRTIALRSHTPGLFHERHARGTTPDPSHCTRSVAVHPIRRGAMPTDRVQRLPQQAQPRAIPPHRTQPSTSDAATQLRHAHPGSEREALHPLRRAAPVT